MVSNYNLCQFSHTLQSILLASNFQPIMSIFTTIISFFYAITSWCRRAKLEPTSIAIPGYYVVAHIHTVSVDNEGQLTNNILCQIITMPLNLFGLQPPFTLFSDVFIPHVTSWFRRRYSRTECWK